MEELFMKNEIGNYTKHAKYWDWGKLDHDRTPDDDYWYNYAKQYGNNALIPMCAWGTIGAYMAERGMIATAFDITPEMVAEGKKHYGNIAGLNLFEGDIRHFRFDIEPVDFCYCGDLGHIHSIEEIKKAFVCINNHMRAGGCLVIETGITDYDDETTETELRTFRTKENPYPDRTVYKTGTNREEAETGRHYISQTMHIEYNDGKKEQFDHEFYLQGYKRQEWIQALKETGFEIKAEYKNREKELWSEGEWSWIVEAVKNVPGYRKYTPKTNLDHLRVPIHRHGNVGLYQDVINLEQPNNGVCQYYKFDINADGNWVGWIQVKIGYTLSAYYDGQIGYMITDEIQRNKGYATNACLALKPFLRKFGYDYITLTVGEENTPSRRVCEKIGAKLIDIIDTPKWADTYDQGQRRTCIYEWKIEDTARQNLNLRHHRINLDTDKDYILECHCRINYECDCPWARSISYEEYRANWFSWINQQNGFLSALTESMEDSRTIAEIVKTESGETVGFLWVPFYGDDEKFIWVYVHDIYIEEVYRKKGIATYLMDYAEKSAKQNGAKVIRSGTGCENIKSQGLHQKLGYYQYRYEYEKVLEDK